ncbi:MAG: diguanylate cyclase [Herbaspirillum sp.]
MNHADGSFAGVVAGALRLNYFRALFAGLNIGSSGSITLVNDNGTIIIRNPETAGVIGRSLAGSRNFDRFKQRSERWFMGQAALDSEHRLYVYRQFHELRMILIVAPSATDVYAAWNQRVWRVGAFAVFLSAALLGAAWLLAIEFKYRIRIEAELLEQSRTDSLTGLRNRRTLDQALETEWRRAVRTKQALALLFIDIDHFKAYNDRYGHQAGDDALAAVARALNQVSQRPGDVMARFGGEEFVALLPDTDLNGASEIARKIHAAIQALNIPHQASQHAQVTVSIGVACHQIDDAKANQRITTDTLLKAADQAMYTAKAAGRNQTAFAPLQD